LPKISKGTKAARDRAVIAGIRKHRQAFDEHGVGPHHLKADDLVARFEEHLQALADIDRYDGLKSEAILREAKLEKEMLELWMLISCLAQGRFGASSTKMSDFAKKPRKEPEVSVATKALAVAKRRETRRVRRTMGKRQRKNIKGGLG
jgi:hypothetical protein